MIERVCQYCGKTFYRHGYKVPEGRGKYCSRTCERKDQIRADAPNIPARFWAHVDKSAGSDGCWPWVAYKNRKGYGQLRAGGRGILAHRMAYVLTNGPIPDGLFVCHTCDNPICCNPAHLFLGTNTDNMQDAAKKGRTVKGDKHPLHRDPSRAPHGEKCGTHKLCTQDVLAIRARAGTGITHRELASRYGVSQSEITQIINRKRWTHI